ncbi:conserved protein of unknown function [Pseudomonas marincola]|uniref:DUF3850 domain-containing protein n=1 Tax=Pseudomonas marincola TaxID=437900 RepID=A0A653E608_9PSED|nr:DUF3850 domain-containing protein [Pseudomonas marincola]CAE6905891.1 conserved protein of unknown function [Pseudomonas marincola]
MHHDLKIRKAFFEAVLSGDKTFEIRDNSDRGFQRGDTFKLIEMSDSAPTTIRSGRTFEGVITYVLDYKQQPGYVVFAFKKSPTDK